MRNHEIVKATPLLDEKGNLTEPGWARQPVFEYEREAIKAPKFRIKEWDYYIVIHDGRRDGTESFATAFTISDDGYIGLQSVSLLHLDEGNSSEHTETVLNAFPMGKLHLPESSKSGDVNYEDDRLKMSFKKNAAKRRITCEFKNFQDGKTLTADILLTQLKADSMSIATPWDKKAHFYYNQKINCMPAKGEVTFDGKTYTFDPEFDYATLDWGRGVWTYDNTWYWGNGNAKVDGHNFGFNIGYGFGNTSAASENIVFLDGVAHKLDDVDFGIPNDVSFKDMASPEYMKPWHMTSSDGRFEAEFVPVLDRFAKMDFKVIVSDQHQVFGRMTGKAKLDDGTELEFKDILVFAEKVHNRY